MDFPRLPEGVERLSVHITVRMTRAEKLRLEARAAAEGTLPSIFARELVLRALTSRR